MLCILGHEGGAELAGVAPVWHRLCKEDNPPVRPREITIDRIGKVKDAPVSTCAIRYRFDGPGPASFLVDHGGVLRVYCRGALSAPLSDGQVKAMLSDQKRRWVAVSGELVLDAGDTGWLGAAGPPAGSSDAVFESA